MKSTLPNFQFYTAGVEVISNFTLAGFRLLAGGLALMVTLITGVAADDTEIFFSQNGDASNVLFVLDTSGSMGARDGGSQSRLKRMQDALNQLLDKVSGINVGVMSYTSRSSMGLKQPVKALDDTHRTNMKNSVNALVPGGGTPTLKALWDSTRYYRGQLPLTTGTSQSHVSPMTHECQQNHIVLLTDGIPTRDVATQNVVKQNISSSCANVNVGSQSNNGTCGAELANYLATRDLSNSVAGSNNVITHTIGFNFTQRWLADVAVAGQGSNYSVDSAESLLAAFDDILGNVNATFAAPTVTANAFNESRHRDELFYTFFQPKLTARWDGNVKKYRLVNGSVVDRNGNPLIDGNGEIDPDSQSLWSVSGVDGQEVKDGGMAALQPANRNWYTDTGAGDAQNNIYTVKVNSGNDVATNLVNAGSAAERDNIVGFVRGMDVLDQNTNNITNEPNHYVADSLHNSPVLLSYWAKESTSQLNEVIFSANNMGVLHAVDAATGQEKWSYTPRELLPNVKRYVDNASGDHTYGLDGNMTLHTTQKATTSYDYEVDKAWLYLTQRRGGRSVIGLDVSNGSSNANPFQVMWKINGATDTDFRDLGQTWATPQIIPVRFGCPNNCAVKEVLMFGGGYNPLYDDKSLSYPVSPASSGHGNAVYFVDPETGERIWSVGNGNHHTLNLPMMDSVPESPIPVDTDSDGVVDILFYSDIGGNVWRIDLDKNAVSKSTLAKSGGQIASLAPVVGGVKQPLRFYNRIDVVINGDTNQTANFNLVLGSGMRSSPLYDEPVLNRVYSIRDPWVFTPPLGDTRDANGNLVADYRYVKNPGSGTRSIITAADLYEFVQGASQANQPVVNEEYLGFYKILTARGEKVLQSTLTHGGRVFLTSYVPPDPSVTNSCGFQLGESRLQIFDLQLGTGLMPSQFQPYLTVGVGIVANGSIVDTGQTGGPDFVTGVNAVKLIDLLQPANPNIFRKFYRTGWAELDD